MRITNNMIQRDSLARLQQGLRGVAVAQTKVSTGLRLQKSSDDPTATVESMWARGSLRALEQYRRNAELASTRVSAEETALDRLGEALDEVRVLGLSQLNSTNGEATRSTVKARTDEIFRHIVQIANSSHAGEFLFGGDAATVQPFGVVTDGAGDLAFTVAPELAGQPARARVFEISAGQTLATSHDGNQVFVDSGVLAAARDMAKAIGANDTAGMQAALRQLEDASGAVEQWRGEVGARMNQLALTAANLDALEVNLKTFRSNLEEIDLEEAVTQLVTRQTAYQAAMLATTKVMGMNLADYLR